MREWYSCCKIDIYIKSAGWLLSQARHRIWKASTGGSGHRVQGLESIDRPYACGAEAGLLRGGEAGYFLVIGNRMFERTSYLSYCFYTPFKVKNGSILKNAKNEVSGYLLTNTNWGYFFTFLEKWIFKNVILMLGLIIVTKLNWDLIKCISD